MLSILEIRYGLNSDNVSPDLLEAIYDACINFHEKLTIDDLRNCFNHAQIEKKQYQKITLDEFIEPIKSYIQVKQVSRQVLIDLQVEQQKQQQQKQKEIDFYNEARKCYLESLKLGEWQGDMFQAKAIARGFWDSLYDQQKKEIQAKATEEFKEAQVRALNDQFYITPDKLYFLANELIKFSVKSGKLFVEI